MRPDGALAVIITRLAAIRRSIPGFKSWEWDRPGARRANLENMEVIRAELIQLGHLKVPVVAAHATLGADVDKGLEAARRLGASTVDDPGAAAWRPAACAALCAFNVACRF